MNKTKKSTRRAIIAGILVVIAATIGIVVLPHSKAEKKPEAPKTTKVSKSKETKSSSSSESSQKEEFTREGAVKATEVMLKELQKSPVKDLTLEARAKEVASGKYDKTRIFTEAGWSKLRLVDFMKKDPRGAVLSAQSMLSVINSIEEAKNKEMKPTSIDYSGAVYFDKELNTAYVPVDLYTNAPTNLSFEMVYLNGEWILQPYSLIAQIAIRNMNKVTADKTPEGTTESAPSKIEEKGDSSKSSDKKTSESKDTKEKTSEKKN